MILMMGIFLMAFLNFQKIKHRKRQLSSISIIPEFEFIKSKGGLYNRNALDKNADVTIFNYFDPDCEHCQVMMKAYGNNRIILKRVQILMITGADSISLRKFENLFAVDSLDEVVLLRDPKFTFFKLFGTISIPAFIIYKNGILYKKITGETSIKNLLN